MFQTVVRGQSKTKTATRSLADVIGVTHVNGRYFLTLKDYLNEGADEILNLGSRVIKVWLYGKRHEHPESVYSFNSDWPQAQTLVEGAQLPYFRNLFDKPFTTYFLAVTSLGRLDDYWINDITQDDLADETRQFFELTRYLLTKYRGTGKTFVLQHWEGDWMVRGAANPAVAPTLKGLSNMVRWLEARQAGVQMARDAVGCSQVAVYNAAEVNRVFETMREKKPNMVSHVLPYVNLDLVSYSSYDTTADFYHDPAVFREALAFIKENARTTDYSPADNVYVGEFGFAENSISRLRFETAIKNATETALDFGCPYLVYWQLYCNEFLTAGLKAPVKNNSDMRGFWLIKPDGTKSWAWHYFHDLIAASPVTGPVQ